MNIQAIGTSCCGAMLPLGAFEGKDLAALDHLAVKLICHDERFAAHFEQIGRWLGHHIAGQRYPATVSFDVALGSLLSSFGLDGPPIESCVIRRSETEAVLQIRGCTALLGWNIPRVGRAVCSFDAALFEGLLRSATGEPAWTVREAACLGFGDAACEFIVQLPQRPNAGSRE